MCSPTSQQVRHGLHTRPKRIPLKERFPNKYILSIPQLQGSSGPKCGNTSGSRNKVCPVRRNTAVQGTLDDLIKPQPSAKNIHFTDKKQSNIDEDLPVQTHDEASLSITPQHNSLAGTLNPYLSTFGNPSQNL